VAQEKDLPADRYVLDARRDAAALTRREVRDEVTLRENRAQSAHLFVQSHRALLRPARRGTPAPLVALRESEPFVQRAPAR